VSLSALTALIEDELREGWQKAPWLTPVSVGALLDRAGDCLPGSLVLLAGGVDATCEDELLPAAVSMQTLALTRLLPAGVYREFLYARALIAITHLPAFVIQSFSDVVKGWSGKDKGEREEKRSLSLGTLGRLRMSEEEYLEQAYAETGVLFASCCQIGARLAMCTNEVVEALTTYGFSLGMAVQIRKDSAPWFQARKNRLPLATPSLPVIHSLEHSEQTRLLLSATHGAVPPAALLRCLRQSGSIAYTNAMVHSYIRKAKASLSVLPSSPVKEALLDVLSTVWTGTGKE
jgi:geranylgeranyl pyrophosphate synthase